MTKVPHIGDDIAIHRLANGITVTLEQLPYLHSAAAGFWVKAGSANEQDREAGVAHFLEHLFFKGTETRTVHEIMEAVEGRGGHLNAFTTREHTCLYVKMLDKHLATGIEILADLARNSLFADLEKERNVVLEEIASIEDTPDEYVHDLLTAQHWPQHPLGRAIAGGQKSVSGLELEHVRGFYETWYQPEDLYFSVAGNFDEDAVLDQIRNLFEDWPGTTTPDRCGAPEFSGGVQVVERDIAQAHVCLAFPGPPLEDKRRYICDMTSCVLGGGSTSRLFERIREEEGLAYAIYTFHSFHTVAGMLGICAAITPPNLGRTLELTFEELRRMREEPVSEKEMDSNREQIKGNVLMALENTFTRMSRMAKCMMYYGRIVPVSEIIENVDAVTPEEIQAHAQQTFTEPNCAVTVLGPPGACKVEKVAL